MIIGLFQFTKKNLPKFPFLTKISTKLLFRVYRTAADRDFLDSKTFVYKFAVNSWETDISRPAMINSPKPYFAALRLHKKLSKNIIFFLVRYYQRTMLYTDVKIISEKIILPNVA